jgi:hypothetical protein
MGRGIFSIDGTNNLAELREQPFQSEDLLQALLASHPRLLPGDLVNSERPRKWLLVSRESTLPDGLQTPGRWYVDHLLLDQDAIPTLVEVKRSSDTRIRREVIGQILEYASNAVVYWPVEKIQAELERECERRGRSIEEAFREHLDLELDAIGSFWDEVKRNLQAGKVRLIIVADEIPTELRRILEFLNGQMDPAEIIGVEIRQFVGNQDQRVLVPTVYGQTEKAQLTKSASGADRLWDANAILEELRLNQPEAFAVARSLREWSESNADGCRRPGRGATGSFRPFIKCGAKECPLFGLWSSGVVELYVKDYFENAIFASEPKASELRTRLTAVGIPSLPDLLGKYPKFPAHELAQNGRLQRFIAAFDWMISQVRT